MIHLTRSDYEAMTAYAREQLPNECCGLLAGKRSGDDAFVEKVYYLNNTDASPEHFSMDPAEQFAVMRDIRQRNLALIGNFHSHPATPSRPSDEDKRLAFDPSLRYLILSLAESGPVLRSFRIRGGEAIAEPLHIEEEESHWQMQISRN
ncbi:MAG: M67 family metallopeptidase [Caecibacter massiliensis]|nr:M67 family metallopeptidase [Caecibacter massiliensis]